MKTSIALALLTTLAAGTATSAQDVYVNGYTTGTGTYVQPHYRTAPDNRTDNNYSSYQADRNTLNGIARSADLDVGTSSGYNGLNPGVGSLYGR